MIVRQDFSRVLHCTLSVCFNQCTIIIYSFIRYFIFLSYFLSLILSFIHVSFFLLLFLSLFLSFIHVSFFLLFIHSFILLFFISFIHSFTNLISFHIITSQTQASSRRIAWHNEQAGFQISKSFSVCGAECVSLKVWRYAVIVTERITCWLTDWLTDYQPNLIN
jgi:hypothetical protein